MLFETILTLSRWTSAEGYHTIRSLSVFILVVLIQLFNFVVSMFTANYLHFFFLLALPFSTRALRLYVFSNGPSTRKVGASKFNTEW